VKKRATVGPARRKKTRPVSRASSRKREKSDVEATPVTAAELRALRRELERKMKSPRRARRQPMRWNPEPDDVQRSVAQLVLTLVEFLRKLMERQAIRRMEQKTLTADQIDAVGTALMNLEKTVRDMGKRFGLTPEELNLDLGPIKLM
jgi:arsenate reductase-like glutaredoxin family protein